MPNELLIAKRNNISPTCQDIDATPLAWREAGTGPVMLFLHGLGGSRTAWEPQLLDLADTYRCVAWDMPGYGASAPGPDSLTFSHLAQAVANLLDALEVKRAVVVGLSLGGMVAQHFALEHPGRISSLVLLDTSPAFGLDGTTDAQTWADQRLKPLAEGKTPGDIAPMVLQSVAGPQISSANLAIAIAAMERISPAGLAATVRCLPSHDTRERLPEISCPTLVLVGDLDTETPPAYSQLLAQLIPQAHYAEVTGAGHLSNLEKPDQVNQLIRNHLKETT